jgi:hypothetical protein
MFQLIVNGQVKHTSVSKSGCSKELWNHAGKKHVLHVESGAQTVDGLNWKLDGVSVRAPEDPPEQFVVGERLWESDYGGLCAND